ncbi:hypothetical protein EDD86DRAFT_146612 [Gorgonomyces haynaldii]|nr:hypothetical protein EDD86DRAFT_146612 [Gorgonomyces haynaldii]
MDKPWLSKNHKKVIAMATFLNSMSYIPAFHYSGLQGLFFVTFNMLLIIFLDICLSENFTKNLKILNANGFSTEQVYQTMFLSLLFGGPGMYCMTQLTFRETVMPYFTHGLVMRVGMLLAISELALTYGHVMLHQQLSKYHLMHHCCKHISYTTNFVFHPFDLVMEFGMPLGVIILANLLLFQDDWATMVALSISVTVYGLDHDEYLQRPHAKHHLQITSPYTAYFDSTMHIKDAVRPMVKSE